MKRLLLLAFVAGTAAVGAPLRAATEFVAIGDSITAGTSWPASCEICPAIFDCSGGCAASSAGREKCGHVRRLDDWIDGWLGAGNHVVNKGVGGEKTMAAVSRLPLELDAKCGTPGDCNAVILMHGTNDMSGTVSPEMARDNLGLMIDEARSRNIDTLLMTIIRKGLAPGKAKWEAYRDLILDLAATEGLQSVDPWSPLCPTTSCYNANYWLAGKSPCFDPNGNPDPGHLDPDGYDVLDGLIQAVFPAEVPDAPVPASPAGDIGEPQPDFVWPEVATARWYELEVDGTTTWWEAALYCAAGSCTADPGVVLPLGPHSWRVRGRNLRGMGDWSADTDFEIWPLPGTPVAVSPTGAFDDVDPFNPPFGWEPYTWDEVVDAIGYDLEVANLGGPVLEQSFDASICVASTCSASPGFGLAGDSYTWTVRARNPGGPGAASSPLAFDVNQLPPGEPTITAPNGDLFEAAPLYAWLEAAGATKYDLRVKDALGNVDVLKNNLLASALCSDGSCAYLEGTVLVPDDYTVKVRGRNDGGIGPYTDPSTSFTVLDCADPSPEELADLEPSPVTMTKSVTHCGPVAAATTVPYTIEPAGVLTVHTRDGFSAHDGVRVEGELTVKSP